jgi:hypothetical protein
MKFYPRDWRGDQALRSVSVAARGLWMECICIMHEAKPYGHLMLNGSPVEGGILARMAGISVDEASALMAELRQAGVLSVTSRGVVFSRRMTKDHARARKGRNAAKNRWAQVSDDVEQSDAPNRSPNRSPITHIPEARKQNPPISPKGDDGFEAFYEAYPRHEGRGQALKAYRLAMKKADPPELLRAAQKYRARRAGEDPKFTPLPASWLNGERWLDDPPTARVSVVAAPVDPSTWAARIRKWRADGSWSAHWGPKPEEQNCQCPPSILEQFKRQEVA